MSVAGWAVTAILTAVAAVLRFWQLGYRTDGGTPIFDEKYYALNSWEVLNNGGYEANPGYGVVVHPPLGKQLIAIGEWLFGYNGLGWRFTTAVCGVHHRRAGDPGGAPDDRVDVHRRPGRHPADLRRGLARAGQDRPAGQRAGDVRRRRLRLRGRRPGPGAAAGCSRRARRQHRRALGRPGTRRPLVAVRRRRAVRLRHRGEVVRRLLLRGVRAGQPDLGPDSTAIGGGPQLVPRGAAARSAADLVEPRRRPGAGLHRQLVGLVRVRDRVGSDT